ncbi:cyclic nucleotide-binding domain-containing protein [Bacteroides caecigallinarum]|uniref:Crp/Fnr family transcriptional regulator n=1 Tax=Bacteroides caecigallinarum TaxID=1411144 RepID=UPI001F3750DB|nr:cyclic nucleotide-binding domain-containing protein [Bacteroides caecigallinarum]MCF2592657.1 cyclic nucleotide-binding domain-containing protein [Bacteroides caecigallinarum]
MNSNIDIAKRIASSLNCTLSKEVLKTFAEILVPEKYKKGERILDEGQVCDSLYFIDKGMTRQFYFKYDKDLTEHIGYEDAIIVCLESYFNEEPTKLMIEALEPTIAWKINKNEIVHLASINSEIGTLYRRIFENSLITSQRKADTLRFEPANERYNKLMQQHPEILKRAPLIYIASLLQMTPETLSRVRSSSLIS